MVSHRAWDFIHPNLAQGFVHHTLTTLRSGHPFRQPTRRLNPRARQAFFLFEGLAPLRAQVHPFSCSVCVCVCRRQHVWWTLPVVRAHLSGSMPVNPAGICIWGQSKSGPQVVVWDWWLGESWGLSSWAFCKWKATKREPPNHQSLPPIGGALTEREHGN